RRYARSTSNVMKRGDREMHDELEVGRWVDDRLAARIPGGEWQPNVLRGLAQLRQRRGLEGRRGRRLLWVVVGTAAACLPLMAFPVTRAFAQHCMSACVTQSSRLRVFFMGKETAPGPRLVFAVPEMRKTAPDF